MITIVPNKLADCSCTLVDNEIVEHFGILFKNSIKVVSFI